MKYCQNPICYLYNSQDRLRGTKGNKVYTNRKRSYFYYANGNFCSLKCQDDWFQQYGDRCIDYIGRITVSPERPQDSVSYWTIRNDIAQRIEHELSREENYDQYSSGYWKEYHRRIDVAMREHIAQFQGESNANN